MHLNHSVVNNVIVPTLEQLIAEPMAETASDVISLQRVATLEEVQLLDTIMLYCRDADPEAREVLFKTIYRHPRLPLWWRANSHNVSRWNAAGLLRTANYDWTRGPRL